jgi:hypothetical protein
MGWPHLAEQQLRKYQPKIVKELESSGVLKEAAESTSGELQVLLKSGSDPWGSREIVMQKNVLLPTEENEPDNSLFPWIFF